MTVINKYRKVQTHTASKERLMVMLFQAGVKQIRNAADFMEEGKSDELFAAVEKATEIVIELMSTLDHKVAPELCQQLEDVYRFTTLRLSQGFIKKDIDMIREAETAFTPIAEAFEMVVSGQAPAPAVAKP